MAQKENVEITAETITDYLSKLCKNTVSIYGMLKTLHEDNLELKKVIVELKIKDKPVVLRQTKDVLSDLEVIDDPPKFNPPPLPVITQQPVVQESLHSPIPMQSTILPGEQPLSVKDQVELALRKKKLDNESGNLRCFKQEAVWLGPAENSNELLKHLQPDTRGLV